MKLNDMMIIIKINKTTQEQQQQVGQ